MGQIVTELVQTRVGKVQVRRGGPAERGPDTPTVVYLHSATGEGEGLPLLATLADSVEVVAPMFPGFGESEGIDQIDDMDDAVFHLLDLWDVLELKAPVVVGLSLGGWMAVELATRYPERVGRLVLINPVGLYLHGAEIKDIFGRSPGEMAEDLFADQDHPIAVAMHAMDALSNDTTRSGEIPFELVRPVFQTMAATARLGWDPYLHDPKLPKRLWRIDAPTLVVRGAQDTLVPAAHAEYYASHIETATHVELERLAHLAPLEDPDRVARLIVRFARGEPGIGELDGKVSGAGAAARAAEP
ncbi:MAG TPA: alpha/beta hydrolase [Acidimicrobiales bacterium]|nr:alpha/beta hydrolase [Acidimicrobiales bacterium]